MNKDPPTIPRLEVDFSDEAEMDANAMSREGEEEDDASLLLESSPLDLRVIEVVAANDRRIRPARLATELGISVNDACAELCGLLAAVGGGQDGASFSFEKIDDQHVMVFTFPKDFKTRAYRNRRRDDFYAAAKNAFSILVKFLKIVTAFGLILSLLILCVAAIIGLLAVIVALTRGGGGHHHRSAVLQRVRSLVFTMRQLLWCYALFGWEGEGQDPFLREIAYDLSLAFSVCCGNPGSIFFWLRARQLSRRRGRAFRGWGDRTVNRTSVDGVTLVHRGTWGDDTDDEVRTAASPQHGEYRGILSVAVEFLFGPTPSYPGPSTEERWKVRAAAIIELTGNNKGGLLLRNLSPFFDKPPLSLNDTALIVEEGLVIVAHFNGVPANGSSKTLLDDARFMFPELVAESSAIYDGSVACSVFNYDGSYASLLYRKESESPMSQHALPDHMEEGMYRLTQLSQTQFMHCSLLGGLNLVGAIWLGQSIAHGGLLEVDHSSPSGAFLSHCLISVLQFYGLLFFAIPATRLALIIALNSVIRKRNDRRRTLAKALEPGGPS